jgi:hypothetical protein
MTDLLDRTLGRQFAGKQTVLYPASGSIRLLPSPNTYLTNAQDVSSEIFLIGAELNTSPSDKEYKSPWVSVDAGEQIIVVTGRIVNRHPQSKEIAMYAKGYDEAGRQVAWTLDATHIAGQIGLRLENGETGQFTLHLNLPDNLKSVRIFANNYAVAPP